VSDSTDRFSAIIMNRNSIQFRTKLCFFKEQFSVSVVQQFCRNIVPAPRKWLSAPFHQLCVILGYDVTRLSELKKKKKEKKKFRLI